ncbi:MAG: helicase C-terminal domain-containing protein [Anaerolineae bacterium]
MSEDKPTYQGPDDDIALLFAPWGPVAELLGEGYRPRRGQALMARLVKRALDQKTHAMIEAGTGSGKSFAYLMPLLWTGRRAFVSTANKTLQTQLWEKDLPALRRIAPNPFSAALLKGRSNYVCRLKWSELSRQPQLFATDDATSLSALRRRLKRTPSGDVEELRLSGELKEQVVAGRHDCAGYQCPFYHECYYEHAKSEAEKADIVVLNHALLAYNLALEQPFLSPRDVTVVDEAHELERYVVNALRLSLEYSTVPGLINDPVVERNAEPRLRAQAMQSNNALFKELSEVAESVKERRWTMEGEIQAAMALVGDLQAIHRELQRTYPPVKGDDENEENARHQATLEWAGQMIAEITQLAQVTPEDHVRYCESWTGDSRPDDLSLQREPLDVAEFLRENLFGTVQTVVCTSATLTVNRRFDYFRRQLGAPGSGAIERRIESPFDFAHQALLYTPFGLKPDYGEGEEAYVEQLINEVERLIYASRGRAFVLCTSTRRMRQLYEELWHRLPYNCLRQGLASRAELLEEFRGDPKGAVLFATRSFWEGVDIPGEALSMVIIDKLPFTPYRDPVYQQREQRVRAAGGNPFMDVALPEATLSLKQGVGRLIRAESDRGVMAVLDSRINTARYGSSMVASLPPARRTTRFEDVVAFFEGEGDAQSSNH